MLPLTQPKLTFTDYLSLDDGTDDRYELIDGELIALPPESESNVFTATWLQFQLAQFISLRLIKLHVCEVQVPILQPGDAANRFPDVVVLRESHLAQTQKRLTITSKMPPPDLIIEVASPGKANQERDYKHKRAQYQAIGVPEYWIADRADATITVLVLEPAGYVELGQFRDGALIQSRFLPSLALTAQQVLRLS
jgi:Uma2 family endonuclease